MSSINQYFFQFLNNLAGRSGIFDAIVAFLGSWFSWLVIAAAVVLIVTSRESKKIRTIFFVFAGPVLGEFVAFLTRSFYNRPRPFETLSLLHQLIPHEGGGSFPSSHATFFFALAMGIYLWHKRWGAAFFVAAFLIAISRVVSGIHWPLDIVAGAILGVFSSMLVHRLQRRVQ